MFCREIFGKKPKKLDFGLQPHRIPDSETVRNHFVVHFMKNKKETFVRSESNAAYYGFL